MIHPDWIVPEWRAEGVGALMTTRAGGFSEGPFATLNLRAGIGDEPADVARNQALLAEAIGASPVFLDQVHGVRVVRLGAAEASASAGMQTADASVTTEAGIACAVQVADCLPVLFAAPAGRGVAAAHAGWRGLAGGVVESTLAALCEASSCAPNEVCTWLGPCIGPRHFEVGADVLKAFGITPSSEDGKRFVARDGRADKWLADLALLARDRLRAAGVTEIDGGRWCTVSEPSRFFSFRRERLTGRMAAAVWIER